MDLVERTYRQCLSRWTGIGLPLEAFRARVKRAGTDPAGLALDDLFLSTACAAGDRVAWEHFADEHVPALKLLARQACRDFQEGEDLAQEIVVGFMERPQKLAGYDGRATLRGWLRAVVARAAVDRFRKHRREVPVEENRQELEAAAVVDPDPLLGEDRRRGGDLAAALAEEIALLPPRDRLMLDLYYLRDVPLRAIGRHFGFHEATASRRLDRLRSRLKSRVERVMRLRHGLRPADMRNLWQTALECDASTLAAALLTPSSAANDPGSGKSLEESCKKLADSRPNIGGEVR